MKKSAIIILITLAIILLAACGGQETDIGAQPTPEESQGMPQDHETPAPQEVQEEPNTEEPDETPEQNNEPEENTPLLFALEVDGFLIEMDQNVNYVLTALGEPLGEFVMPSCAFDGEDRVFQYSSLQIHTYPVGDEDRVHTISLRDDNIRTSEGNIRLGASLEDVIAAYGDDYEKEFNMHTFTRERTKLQFYIEDGRVLGITFGLIIQ